MRPRSLVATALACLTLMTAFAPGPASAASSSGWTAPWKLDVGLPGVDEIELAALPEGGLLAVWISPETATLDTLYYSERLAGEGWQPAAVVQQGRDLQTPSLSVNSQGQGALVWMLYDSITTNYGSFYRYGTGFTPPHVLNNNTYASAWSPAVAVNEAGVATALWTEEDAYNYSAFAARGDTSSGVWSAAEVVESSSEIAYPERVGIAVDGSGAAYAIWRQSEPTSFRVMVNVYTPLVGWGKEQGLDNASGGTLENLRIAVLADGRAFAFWTQQEWFTTKIPFISTYAPARGWDAAPTQLPTVAAASADAVEMACGGPATCLISWSEVSGPSQAQVITSTTDGGATFSSPQTADASLLGRGYYSDVAVTPEGAGVVAWAQDPAPPSGTSTYSAYARAFDPVAGFGATVRLDRISSQPVGHIQAAAGASGLVAAMWTQAAGSNVSGFAASFGPIDTVAPTLRLTSPADGALLTEPSAIVSGITDGGASVSVNGELALVRPNGTFMLRVPLTAGPNTIRAVAFDAAGNSFAVTLSVNVSDPVASLASDLAVANATLANLTFTLGAWQGENTRLNDTLGVAQAEIERLNDSLGVTQAAMDRINDTLGVAVAAAAEADARADIANASAGTSYTFAWNTMQDLGRTQSELNTTRAQAASAQGSASLATVLGGAGIAVGALGAALAIRAGRGGGGGGGGGGGLTGRQTPKRDFGDRMKAGLDTAGGIGSQGSDGVDIGSQGSDGVARGPRQSTSVDGSYDGGIGSQGSDDFASGPRQATSVDGSYSKPPNSTKFAINEQGVPDKVVKKKP